MYDRDDNEDIENLKKKSKLDLKSLNLKEEMFDNFYDEVFTDALQTEGNKIIELKELNEKVVKKCPIVNCDKLSEFIESCVENLKELNNIEKENSMLYENEESHETLEDITSLLPEDSSLNETDNINYIFDREISLLNNLGVAEIVDDISNKSCEKKEEDVLSERDLENTHLIDHCYTKLKEPLVENKSLITKSKYVVGRNWTSDPYFSIEKDKYKLEVPLENLNTLPQIVYYMFKHLPLYTEMAKVISYSCMYPYAATSLEQFMSWNPTKQFCSEVSLIFKL